MTKSKLWPKCLAFTRAIRPVAAPLYSFSVTAPSRFVRCVTSRSKEAMKTRAVKERKEEGDQLEEEEKEEEDCDNTDNREQIRQLFVPFLGKKDV